MLVMRLLQGFVLMFVQFFMLIQRFRDVGTCSRWQESIACSAASAQAETGAPSEDMLKDSFARACCAATCVVAGFGMFR